MARKAIKVFVDEEAHDLLHENKEQTGETISDTVNDLVLDIIRKEVEARREKGVVTAG